MNNDTDPCQALDTELQRVETIEWRDRHGSYHTIAIPWDSASLRAYTRAIDMAQARGVQWGDK